MKKKEEQPKSVNDLIIDEAVKQFQEGKIKNSLDASFILWNIDTLDWKNKDSDYLTDYVLKEVNDGNIILFHDIHKTSIDAINKLLPLLYVNGYQVVTVSKLAEVTGTNLELHKTYRYFKK